MSLSDFIKNQKGHIKTRTKSQVGDDGIIYPNLEILRAEYERGLQVADPCHIPGISEIFAWKRGFQNCWTGYPNDGKSTFALFVMVMKSLADGWKWVIWSPEMKSGTFHNGTVEVNYNDLINEIIWMIDGRTPHRHIAEKYNLERIPWDDYIGYVDWVKSHFLTIDPKHKKPENIEENLLKIYENQGFDGILIDPFKNIEQDIRTRDDIYLEQLFARFKDLAIRCNCSMNWIAHPRANVSRIVEGVLKPCDQYMLNGGAAWNNSMDGIYSIFRPDMIEDIRSTRVIFLNLKQRKQELTTPRGAYEKIDYDIKKHRYIFDGRDILNNNKVEETPF